MNLEVQSSQLAKLLSEEQQKSLLNTPKVNLKEDDIDHYKAITLRSGKELKEPKK